MAKSKGKDPRLAALGRLGGKKGGPARAKKLTSAEKKAIARKGGLAKARKSSIPKKTP